MTYRTHREFALGFVLLATMLVYWFKVTDTNYYVSLCIMALSGRQGGLFPDVDHIWRNVKEKTPINWVINKLIHITRGVHRSRQTHSWDICIVSGALAIVFDKVLLEETSQEMLFILILGFWSGWASHLLSDMLTSDGVYLSCFCKKRKAIVPRTLSRKKIILVALVVGLLSVTAVYLWFMWIAIAGLVIDVLLVLAAVKLGNIRFNTGNEWEYAVFKVVQKFNIIILIVSLIYPWILKLVQ